MNELSFLIVDNNSIALRELAEILQYIGYENIHNASSANDAWAMLRVKPFDCIISSLEMADMSGLALLKIVRSDDKIFDTPFFLTSSNFTKLKIVEAGQSGVTGLIVMPYDIENIKKKVSMLFDIEEDVISSEMKNTLDEGLKLIENEDYEKALEVFDKLVQQGETAEYYYNIGYIKTTQEKYSEAITAFRKATQLDRLFAKAYEAMGRVYHKLGKPNEAEKYLQKAADIYMSNEKMQYAEEILNEILEISPDTVNVYNSLGVLHRKKGDLDTALKNYIKAIKVHPGEPFIHYNIGRLYLEKKEIADAKHHFKKAVSINPEFTEAKEVLKAIELGSI
jgi:tetratricopeptide (TPR) repeat protein